MKLLDVGESLTEEEIENLEQKIATLLPIEYKKFIEKNNGGTPEKMIGFYFTEIEQITKEQFEQGLDVQYFYNINELYLRYKNLVTEEVIPAKYIPFACDSCGNEILLCADGSENDGKVYFSNHEMYEYGNGFWMKTQVAKSFNAFLGKLQPLI